ncbi:hypothetical protein RUND412_002100 [Rhizina undulata]
MSSKLFRYMMLAIFAVHVHGHHMFTTLSIDGVDQGDGTCIRVPPTTSPVKDVTSDDMACNVNGDTGVARICSANAGSTVTLQWRTWPDGSEDTPIDTSHQGPCSVYMKRVNNATTDTGSGSGWFKIWTDGYQDGAFCTDRLIANGGKMTVKIPKDLAAGQYLLRGEHLALHEAQNVGGAQWYIGCAQLFVYSTGGSASPKSVSIPGYVTATDPGVLFNYWANEHPTNYVIPGPAAYTPTSAGGGVRVQSASAPVQGQCLVANANWCAVSVPSFTNEATCYSSTENCWNQLSTCYSTAPATGHTGCTKYEAICTSFQTYCATCGAARNCNGNFPSSSYN